VATVFYANANELATLTNTFSVSGVATDPTAISLTVTDPTGTATTYTYALAQITRSGAGIYTKDIPCSTAGEWQYLWTGTSAASDAQAGTWTVYETDLGHLYVTPQMLKSRLGITGTSDDYELHAACFAASRAIEQYCNRIFWRSASAARTFVPMGWYELELTDYNDLVSITTLKTDTSGDGTFDVTWSASDYQLLPFNPGSAPETRPYTRIRAIGTQMFPLTIPLVLARMNRVEITGVWGWPTVPIGIREASLILAAETFRLKDAPFGVAGFGEFGAVRIRNNPMVAYYADPYRRNAILGA
jgi:hypothetical protein